MNSSIVQRILQHFKGVKTRDPLFPYLFSDWKEGLSSFGNKAASGGFLSGYTKGQQRGLQAIYLLFADDALVSCEDLRD